MEAGPSARIRANLFPRERDESTLDGDQAEPLFGPSSASAARSTALASSKDGLYALLNLPKDATPEAIGQRYKALAILLHPDKQRTPEGRAAAETHFRLVQRASEVLLDPHSRAVYDALGEEGLKDKLEVGPKYKDHETLREEYRRQAQEKRDVALRRLVNAKGDITLAFDAQALTAPTEAFTSARGPGEDSWPTRVRFIQPTRLAMSHSFQMGLGSATNLTVLGRMTGRPRGGKLGGTILGTLTHQYSPTTYLELSSSLLAPQIVGARFIHQFDDDTSLNVSAQAPTLLCPPALETSLYRRVFSDIHGFLTFRTGFYTLGSWGQPFVGRRQDVSALVVGLTSQAEGSPTNGWTLSAEFGPGDINVNADWAKIVPDGVEFKVGAGAGLSDIKAFIQAARKLTEHTKLTLSLEVGQSEGMTLKIKLFRLGQRITVPVLIAARGTLYPKLVLAAIVIPCAAYTAVHHLFLLPAKHERAAKRLADLREENHEVLTQMKSEAEGANLLMQPMVQRRRQEEEAKDGLIILDSQYGALSTFSSYGLSRSQTEYDRDFIEVNVPLQALVNDSQLVIPGGRPKSGLLGFYDVALGRKKKLRVRYLFRGKLHEATCGDYEPLQLPQREHLLE